MERLLTILFCGAVLTTLSGCASADIRHLLLDDTPRSPKGKIEVFTASDNIDRPYKTIALITAESYSEGELLLIQKAIERATSIGADAIIITTTMRDQKDATAVVPVGGMMVAVDSRKRAVKGTAIVWIDEELVSPPPSSQLSPPPPTVPPPIAVPIRPPYLQRYYDMLTTSEKAEIYYSDQAALNRSIGNFGRAKEMEDRAERTRQTQLEIMREITNLEREAEARKNQQGHGD